MINSTNYKFKIINEMVSKEDNLLTVVMLCNIAGVSKSGYYNWIASEENRIKQEDTQVIY